jgi:putative peptidoglycan lipid II flippase
MTRARLLRAAGTIAVANALGLPLGLLVQMLMARAYGTSAAMDAFNIALLIPNSLTTVVVANASVLLVPVINEYLANEQKQELSQMLSAMFKGLFLFAVVGLGALVFCTRPLLGVIAHGFNAETQALTERLFLYLLPAAFFMLLGGVVGVILQANYHFAGPAFAPFLYKILAITFIFYYANEWGIFALLNAQIVSAIASAVLLWLIFRGYQRLSWRGSMWHPVFPQFLAAIFGPLLLFRILDQLNYIVPQAVATHFPEGSVAALGYAFKLVSIPSSLMMTSLATAVFPMYSRLIAEGNWDELRNTIAFGIKTVFLFSIPLTIGFVILGREVVRTLLEREAFGADSTEAVYRLLIFYAAGILGVGLNSMLGYYFWAKRAHWRVTEIISIGVGLNMAVVFGLRGGLGVLVVPIGMGLGYLGQSMFMAHFIHKDGITMPWKALGSVVARMALGGCVMGGVLGFLKWYVPMLSASFMGLVVLIAVGSVVFFGGILLLGVYDLRQIAALFLLPKSKQ